MNSRLANLHNSVSEKNLSTLTVFLFVTVCNINFQLQSAIYLNPGIGYRRNHSFPGWKSSTFKRNANTMLVAYLGSIATYKKNYA